MVPEETRKAVCPGCLDEFDSSAAVEAHLKVTGAREGG